MSENSRRSRSALTIAGSDPTGGAGLQADLRTFEAHGLLGASAVTAITVQTRAGVTRVVALAPDLVAGQIDAAIEDRGAIDATKIGMLADNAVVEAVAAALARHRLRHVVLDPVMRATAGGQLLEPGAVPRLVAALFPLAEVVTPNLDEARALTGIQPTSVADLRAAAVRLVELGARAVVVKGGHLDGDPVDVVYDGRMFAELSAPRIAATRTHGTGCIYSSALAARLALGDGLVEAARAAKQFVSRAIAAMPPA